MSHATSRRAVLRAATADAHSRVDEAVGAFSQTQAYIRYLSGLYAFRAPLEASLEGFDWPSEFGPWRPTTIAGHLEADLADLGVAPPPFRVQRANLSQPSAVFGTVYVLEGSSLGARLLLKSAESLGYTASHGAAHLARQSASHQSWRTFLDLLESADEIDMSAVVDAAIETFEAAHEALRKTSM